MKGYLDYSQPVQSDPDINERDALQALIDSDGWTLFEQHIQSQWGAHAYAANVHALNVKAKQEGWPSDRLAAEQFELGAAVQTALLLVQWPKKRVLQLRSEAQPKGFARLRRAGG